MNTISVRFNINGIDKQFGIELDKKKYSGIKTSRNYMTH